MNIFGKMILPYSEELNIERLSRLFDNTSECYKFFWFKAIVSKVINGETKITYESIVDDMIVDAWYMVTEYHLKLGPKDTLESIVNLIKEKNTALKPSEDGKKILDYLKETDDRDIISKKRILTRNVPYRLQAPFMENMKGTRWDVGERELIERINQEERLIYYIDALRGLETKIIIQDDWSKYIIKNQEIIKGWLEYNLIRYLQRRNPSVPGISDKLYPPHERKLDKIKKYWSLIVEFEPIREIYSDTIISSKDLSIDHFVPWSYVAHDEMWNLNPTTKSINSSKSNNLPDWDLYFKKLAHQEYLAYDLMWKNEKIHSEFDKCAREHINSDDVLSRVYRKDLTEREFQSELEAVIRPVYQSAVNCGFSEWRYKGNESI